MWKTVVELYKSSFIYVTSWVVQYIKYFSNVVYCCDLFQSLSKFYPFSGTYTFRYFRFATKSTKWLPHYHVAHYLWVSSLENIGIQGVILRNSSVIKQKRESQNGCYLKTKHVKFSEKRTFLTPQICKHISYWDSPFCLITDELVVTLH